tara:strand:- start:356 stop:517 length:162 start_codon:yes stop_codon:yes gene_type:complete
MKKPIDKDFDSIRDYMIAVEAYVKFLEEKVNELEYQIWEKEIFEREKWERDNC